MPDNQYPFTIAPTPLVGQGAYNLNPGLLGLPDPYGDLASVYPDLAGTNEQLSRTISGQLGGYIAPGDLDFMQDTNAAAAVGGGMPGAGYGNLFGNRSARNLGLTQMQLQQQGIENYNRLIPTISQTQTVSPELQTQIANINAINLAAGDEAKRQAEERAWMQTMLNSMAGRSMPSISAPNLPSIPYNSFGGYAPTGGSSWFETSNYSPTPSPYFGGVGGVYRMGGGGGGGGIDYTIETPGPYDLDYDPFYDPYASMSDTEYFNAIGLPQDEVDYWNNASDPWAGYWDMGDYYM